MKPKTSVAFAPAVITNFFSIHDEPLMLKDYSDLSRVGATGGGYMLSKGVTTRATRFNGSGSAEVKVVVNGDPTYAARTTEMALRMLIDATKPRFGALLVEQRVDVPIGQGFGASGASALSAVYAAAAALGLDLPKRKIAYFAHAADILSQTGLGTVSVIYGSRGAGAITKSGGPGISRFLRVKTPEGLRIVTASLAPYSKSRALSSRTLRERINRFGDEALKRVEDDPTLETLAEAGRSFADRVGLKTKEASRLIETAEANGSFSASQNMIGYAVHALVMKPEVGRVVRALGEAESVPRIDVFEVSSAKAGLRTHEEALYPTVRKL